MKGERKLTFEPEQYRNESEVESKLIVQYLLPQLGYSQESWYQEVALGSIRLDFLAFATQVIPFVLDENSPLGLIIEAKHPRENLDRHIRKFGRYLTKLHVKYGLLTNGKEIRIYHRLGDNIELAFQCSIREVEAKINQLRAIIGQDSLKLSLDRNCGKSSHQQFILDRTTNEYTSQSRKQRVMDIISVYHNKGGVGKTTTVINLAAALRKKGKKVLVIDLDSQANTTFALGLAKFIDEKDDDLKDSNVYHLISSKSKYSIDSIARKSDFSTPEIDVVPSHISLMEYEKTLIEIDAAKTRISKKLSQIEDKYDVVIIDTPPSLNLYARIALITADYLIIPSDLKPFANEGLRNVSNFVKDIDEYREVLGKSPLNIMGVLPSKVSTNSRFRQHTLPKRESLIKERYGFPLMTTRIFEREDLAKAVENTVTMGELDIPDPRSVLDYNPDSPSAEEFENLASEVMQKLGMNP